MSVAGVTGETIRDTEVKRKVVPENTRLRVWTRAAGRCVLCATYLLDGADWFWHAVPVGQVAHIVGASSGKNAPRGQSDLSENERALEENLLLLCYPCHKRIDSVEHRAKYSVEFLTKRKRLHERRVREVTDFATLRPTSVITVTSDIRGSVPPISLAQVAEALRAEGYTGMGDDTRNGAFTCELPGSSNDSWVWEAHKTALDRLANRVAEAVTAGDIAAVSVFALAPIPSLVYLGSRLDDKTEIRLFRRKRVDDVTAWAWTDGTAAPAFSIEIDSDSMTGHADNAIVVLELSSRVKTSRLPAALTNFPSVKLSPTDQIPNPEMISTRSALDRFVQKWIEVLARIEDELPHVHTLHVIAAVPAPVAIALGRHRMRTAQPKMVIYQLNDECYEAALEINE